MERWYNERIIKNVTTQEMHDLFLGSDSWKVSSSMLNVSENQLANLIQFDDPKENFIENHKSPKLKEFQCISELKRPIKINARSGLLLSPNYPDNYPKSSKCGWELKVPKGTQITLRFITFDVKVCTLCIYDLKH